MRPLTRGGKSALPLRDPYLRGLQASVRNNAAAYGYSVMITASVAALAAQLGSPTVGEAFLAVLGAAMGFTTVEAAATRGFRERTRGEQADVVVLGSALGFASVGLGVGTAALAGELIGATVGWLVGPLLATIAYLMVVAIELTLAERAAKSRRS